MHLFSFPFPFFTFSYFQFADRHRSFEGSSNKKTSLLATFSYFNSVSIIIIIIYICVFLTLFSATEKFFLHHFQSGWLRLPPLAAAHVDQPPINCRLISLSPSFFSIESVIVRKRHSFCFTCVNYAVFCLLLFRFALPYNVLNLLKSQRCVFTAFADSRSFVFIFFRSRFSDKPKRCTALLYDNFFPTPAN